MDNINDIIKTMKEKDITMTQIFERITAEICDNYCKYADQFNAKDDDINFDKLICKHCNNCIMNLLV